MHLHVAGAQLPVTHNVTSNVAAIERGIAYAVRVGADILLTPEGSLSGYTATFDRAEVKAGLSAVTESARVAGLGLALGTCYEEPDGLCYNQIRLYDRDGSYLGFHSKQLRCGTLAAVPDGEINDYAAAPLRIFTFGAQPIGGLICNDLWANPECTPMDDPHLTQVLARKGARVLFHAVNGGRDGSEWSRVAWQYHEANLRMRARGQAMDRHSGLLFSGDASVFCSIGRGGPRRELELPGGAPGGAVLQLRPRRLAGWAQIDIVCEGA